MAVERNHPGSGVSGARNERGEKRVHSRTSSYDDALAGSERSEEDGEGGIERREGGIAESSELPKQNIPESILPPPPIDTLPPPLLDSLSLPPPPHVEHSSLPLPPPPLIPPIDQ